MTDKKEIKQLFELLSQLNYQQWESVKTIVDMAYDAKFKNEKVSFDKAIDMICEDMLRSK